VRIFHQFGTKLTRCAAVSSPKESHEYDLIIVCSGAARTSAAIATAEKGATVIVLDQGHGGGSSRLSGGIVYAGGGTKYQKAAGYDETPENMFNYLKLEVRGAVDDETLKRFCYSCVETLAGLRRAGPGLMRACAPLNSPIQRKSIFCTTLATRKPTLIISMRNQRLVGIAHLLQA
jgi:hypothetical protein